MSSLHEARTLGPARLSFADAGEIEEFVAVLGRYERGELTPDQWRAFRLVRGTYGQRQADDAQMLRVKIPQGVLDGAQLHALADVAERWSRGFGHVTTRQNVQFHFMKLHDVEPAMRRLAAAGLTTREACGNSVRNVTACPYAGAAAGEAFDVVPYAEALTRHLLRHPLASTLPRKFKIAFEGCPEDHVLAAINDLGFRARRRAVDGRGGLGFRVTVGGGTSILPRSGELLHEYLPAGSILHVAEAVLRVYARLGDYAHRQRNRLKFLIRDLGGFEAWRAHYDRELAQVRAEGGARLPFDPDDPPREQPPIARPLDARRSLPVLDPAYSRWRATNVRAQSQDGYCLVTIALPLGDVTGRQLRALADLAAAFSDGTVRTTLDQDLLLRWVRAAELPGLYRRLAAHGLATDGAGTIADVASCPGAESCRLAVTQSRGLGGLLERHLRERPGLAALAPELRIKISGCPNGCGQHHVAGLGFQGSVRRLGDRVVPQYFVMAGGGTEGETARFGRLVAKVPARRVPEAVARLLEAFAREGRPGETAVDWLGRSEPAHLRSLLSDLEALSAEDAEAEDYVDLGEEREFRLETMEGECSA